VSVPDLLRRLLATPGPSGSEHAPAAVWREAASAFADVTSDVMGNSLARVAGTGDGPLLALFGHVDEIGLTVTHADEQGFLAFRLIGGGVDPQILLAQRVEILTRDGPVPGVIAARTDPERREDKKAVELKHLHIDIGARDAAEARKLVRPGDAAVLAVEPLELRNGRLTSRALDNRIGAYVVLEVARRLAEGGGAPGDVVAVATVEEEVGDFLGARTSAFTLEPALAVAVDIMPATDAPGGQHGDYGELKLGAGPALVRGPGIAPRLFDLLAEAADAEGISYGVEVSRGKSGTDADAVYVSRSGVPAGVVSVPIRYIHSPIELVQLDDVEAAVRLLVAFASRLEPGLDLSR
jgi:endoglucanase